MAGKMEELGIKSNIFPAESFFTKLVLCLVAQLYPTLCDPMDCSLPGSSVPGIFQAGVLEWGAIAFSCYSPPNSLDPAAWASLLHQE